MAFSGRRDAQIERRRVEGRQRREASAAPARARCGRAAEQERVGTGSPAADAGDAAAARAGARAAAGPEPEPVPEPVPAQAAAVGLWSRGLQPAEPRGRRARARQAPPLRDRRPAAAPRASRARAPAGLARSRSRIGRRVGSPALVFLIVAALVYVAIKTFQPFHDDPTGLRPRRDPRRASGVGAIGDLLEERGVIDSATFFELNATVTGRRGGLRPGDYTLQREHDATATVARRALGGPKAKVVKTFKLTLPEGLSIARDGAARQGRGRARATTSTAAQSERACAARAASALPRGAEVDRGLPVPGHLRRSCDGAPARRARRPAARRLPRTTSRSLDLRKAQAPQAHPLRRADHRLDGRARGARSTASGR